MIKEYAKLFRVSQWIKNSFVFVPVLFSLHLFDYDFIINSIAAFIIYCFASSIVYAINDVKDAEADRSHPVKKNRPVASGKISDFNAIIAAGVLFGLIVFPLFLMDKYFILTVAVFFVLNIFYTFSFKHIVLLDVFSIAMGFMLRVIGGAFAINVEISNWLILTTMFISLFLAIMKRRSELELHLNEEGKTTRKVLESYSVNYTEHMATITAAGVIIFYALYTVSERTVQIFGTDDLLFTTPFVVFGIFRYMFLAYQNHKGENAAEAMITDIPMMLNLFLYILTVIIIIY